MGQNKRYGDAYLNRPAAAQPPKPVHVWVRVGPQGARLAPAPGLLLEWRCLDGRWFGLVAWTFDSGSGLQVDWRAADDLTPVFDKEGRPTRDEIR